MASLWGLALSGCAPALDWRTMTVPDTALQAQFPCRPTGMTREVSLAGTPARWTLHACDAQGMTFGVAWAELAPGVRTEAVLDGLAQQARSNLQAEPAVPPQAASVPGMTPNRAAHWWHWQGRAPSGQALAQQQLLFVHGTRVFQASVVGGTVNGVAARAFFDALQVRP